AVRIRKLLRRSDDRRRAAGGGAGPARFGADADVDSRAERDEVPEDVLPPLAAADEADLERRAAHPIFGRYFAASTPRQRSWTTRIPAAPSFSAAASCRMPLWSQTTFGRRSAGSFRISSAISGIASLRRN